MLVVNDLFHKAHLDTMVTNISSKPTVPCLPLVADTLFWKWHHPHLIYFWRHSSPLGAPVTFRWMVWLNGIIKSIPGGKSCWHTATHLVLWRKQVIIGLPVCFLISWFMESSPYFPFTSPRQPFFFLSQIHIDPLCVCPDGLICLWATEKDLKSIQKCVLKAHFKSIKHFEAAFKNWIKDFDFYAESQVLV